MATSSTILRNQQDPNKTPRRMVQISPSKWHWYMDPMSSILYRKDQELWFQLKPLGPMNRRTTCHQTKSFYPTTQLQSCSPPNRHLLPTTIQNDPITGLATTNVSSKGFPNISTQTIHSSNFYQSLIAHPFYARLLSPISMSLDTIPVPL